MKPPGERLCRIAPKPYARRGFEYTSNPLGQKFEERSKEVGDFAFAMDVIDFIL